MKRSQEEINGNNYDSLVGESKVNVTEAEYIATRVEDVTPSQSSYWHRQATRMMVWIPLDSYQFWYYYQGTVSMSVLDIFLLIFEIIVITYMPHPNGSGIILAASGLLLTWLFS